MPIKEFRCLNCGVTNELIVDIGRNSDPEICRSCGSSQLEPILSAPSPLSKTTENAHFGGSCCGSSPNKQGCVPGSCCGAKL
jgi:putative FmdB family regulatory protein